MGADDPASHAYRGPTPRNRSMFGPPGRLYVYRSYGVHFCANVVTSPEGTATAVLLRALEPVDGLSLMRSNRDLADDRLLCAGPGRLCQALGINLDHDAVDLQGPDIIICDGRPGAIASGVRIGISTAADRPWRFVHSGSRFLSRPVPRS